MDLLLEAASPGSMRSGASSTLLLPPKPSPRVESTMSGPCGQKQRDAMRTKEASSSLLVTTLPTSSLLSPSSTTASAVSAHPCQEHLAVVLSRPCTSIPWGITLSVVEGRMLLVGSVACDDNNNKSSQQQHWQQIRRHSSADLRRGDFVLAVNGRPVHAFGGQEERGGSSLLIDVTNHMRQCVTLHLAVWRVQPRQAQMSTTTHVRAHASHEAARWQGWHQQQQHLQQQQQQQCYQFYSPLVGTSPVARVSPASPIQYGYGIRSPPYYTPSTSTTMVMPGSSARMKPVVTPPAAPRTLTVKAGQYPYPAAASVMPVPAPKCLLWADPYTNPLFRDADGRPIPYDDNWEPADPDEGQRWKLFVAPVGSFHEWLSRRKAAWRSTWDATKPVLNLVLDSSTDDDDDGATASAASVVGYNDRRSSAVPVDFWSPQGFGSWDEWLHASKQKWSKSYSWNERKRKHFEIDAKVSLDDDVLAWLQVRKRQWLMSRRKRQRQRQQQEQRGGSSVVPADAPRALCVDEDPSSTCANPLPFATVTIPATTSYNNSDILLIDELLEEEERRRKALEDRPPLDLSFLFEECGACPDDTVVHVLGYLDPMEHGKLLCIRRQWRQALIRREGVWRDLCPKRWTLPRRPRKPWHEMYLSNLRREKESSQKLWDDLLSKLSKILTKGDYVQQVEKLVDDAERSFGFHINYSSGVVCERNAILNLAVIQKRHKIARWLVEVKHADIETFDRGHFTPLLNAAWGGDKYMVRFLLQHGADRTKVGFYHYTKPLSSPDFAGLNAAGWAEKKGYDDISTLIRLGL